MTTEEKARQLALSLVGEDQNPKPLIEALIEMAEWQKKQKILDDYYTFLNGEKHFARYIIEMIKNGWHIEAIKTACNDKIKDDYESCIV